MRIYSTSGTTGTPSYIPLTAGDVDVWVRTSARSYGASGVKRGDRIVSTYNAGPFVAGAALDAFARLGLCHIPVGTGNTDRLIAAVERLKPNVVALTPSYALHLAEWAETRGVDLAKSSVERLMVAGEPGGGEPAMRAKLEAAWGATVTEAMGIGDISPSLWGECEAKAGMHFSGRGFVHFELIDPASGAPIPLTDGAEGELVLTHLVNRSAPLLRFRTRDHVRLGFGRCACGRTAPRVRCVGRTDDMLIVRGVNLFPTALREIVNEFAPATTGVVMIKPTERRRAPGSAAAGEGRGRRSVAVRARRTHPRPRARGAAGDRRNRTRRRRLVAAQRIQVQARRPSVGETSVQKLQTQGVHHITLVGADRQTSIDFWEGLLGMPFVFEQPNLDNAKESHIYFDPGDGRLITVFTREDRKPDPRRTPTDPGCVHHIAFNVSRAVFMQAIERLDARGIKHTGVRDRKIFDAIYFEDPLGLLIELSCYKFEPPFGCSHADVLFEAHKLRVAAGDRAIAEVHLADAIENLVARSRPSLSEDRTAEGPLSPLT